MSPASASKATAESVQRPSVLIVAPNASTRFGGESFLPFHYFQILRKRGYPVRLLTHARNRADLKEVFGPDLTDVSFVEDSAAHRLVWRIGSRFPKVLQEIVFGTILRALDGAHTSRIVRGLVRSRLVDVIHQPTPVSPLAPSGLHRFGPPIIIGPMNGGMNYPPGYEDIESSRAKQIVGLSRKVAGLLNRLQPGKRQAAVLLVANDRTRAALPFADHPDIRIMVENAVDLGTFAPRRARTRAEHPMQQPFRLIFMGRLVDWKMVDLTLEAVGRCLKDGTMVNLDILGDGPDKVRLEVRAKRMGVEGAVRFHGFLPQEDCARILAEADALILNSVRECGGSVVLEAMALGLPVIASDWGGPADYLDGDCGILVSPVPRVDFAARLSEAITKLAQDPALGQEMGAAGARKVVRDYDWEKKVDRMIEIYAEVAKARLRT